MLILQSVTCEFSIHDFTSLSTLDCGAYGGFDIILCNPPYLSERAITSRVTEESLAALHGGITGYEAYEEICRSLREAIEEGTKLQHPFLKPLGHIIFQLGAAGAAFETVSKILEKYDFTIDDVVFEKRGIKRGIVAKFGRI